MDESNLGLCLIRSEEHGTKIVRVQVDTRHIIIFTTKYILRLTALLDLR